MSLLRTWCRPLTQGGSSFLQRIKYAAVVRSNVEHNKEHHGGHHSEEAATEIDVKFQDKYDAHGNEYTERPSPWGIPVRRLIFFSTILVLY